MARDLDRREDVALAALRRELDRLDDEIVDALERALERSPDSLTGGDWSDDAGGCLLTLAARELGCAHGSDLLVRSVAAVRIPAVFDDVWAILIERTGDPRRARRIAVQIVGDALDARRATFERTPVHVAQEGELSDEVPALMGRVITATGV